MDATKSSKIFFFSLLAIICALTVLLLVNHDLYTLMSREDRLFEYLSALALAITGVFFMLSLKHSNRDTSFMYKNWRSILLLILGIGFLLTAGEEISWGQRIFSIQTPEALQEINDQDEFNFHNINKRFFDDLLDRSTIAFVLVCSLLLFFNRSKVLGIQMPNIFLICAFAITPFYHQYGVTSLDFHHVIYIVFLALVVYAFLKRRTEILLVVAISFILTLLIRVIHINYHDLFKPYNNSSNEYKEFLFSACCAFYSVVIYQALKRDEKLDRQIT